jgi:hypothetical protein
MIRFITAVIDAGKRGVYPKLSVNVEEGADPHEVYDFASKLVMELMRDKSTNAVSPYEADVYIGEEDGKVHLDLYPVDTE